ncbi:MAG: nucleotidyltransferase domain-containing protein [Chloroflexota bacterium]|jgi:predicted nucleotidyltransferase
MNGTSPTIERVTTKIASVLREVVGIDAVVLGGSHATGHATAKSDIDIGVYYGGVNDLDLLVLNNVVQLLDDAHRANLVTSPGGWGPWVNAGAWMEIDGQHVDLILRDTRRVMQVIAQCESGRVEAHYQPGHPHAYVNVMYMGELAESQLLYDATSLLTPLKIRAQHYPDELQKALIDLFGFEARFSSELASKSVSRNDLYYVSAHIIRSISCVNQVIFAVNRHYCLNEKKAVMRAAGFAVSPQHYAIRVEQILMNGGKQSDVACDLLKQLVDETLALSIL